MKKEPISGGCPARLAQPVTGGSADERRFDIRGGETHIEVHKFRAGAIIIATLLALVIQTWTPVHISKAALLDCLCW